MYAATLKTKQKQIRDWKPKNNLFRFRWEISISIFVECQNIGLISNIFQNNRKNNMFGIKATHAIPIQFFCYNKKKILFRCCLLYEVNRIQRWNYKNFWSTLSKTFVALSLLARRKKTLVHITNSIDELTKSISGTLQNSQLKWEIVNIHLKWHSNFQNSNHSFYAIFNFLLSLIRFSFLAIPLRSFHLSIFAQLSGLGGFISQQNQWTHNIWTKKKFLVNRFIVRLHHVDGD